MSSPERYEDNEEDETRTTLTTGEISDTAISPMDLPEIVALIVSYLDNASLVQASRVSHTFHQICTPFIWRDISLEDDHSIWKSDKGFRLGFIRYGRLISSLALHGIAIQDGDLELIAENCTRLKSLDLTGTNVTVETLRVLIHGDPYGTKKSGDRNGSKRKRTHAKGGSGDDATYPEDDQEQELEVGSERQTDGDSDLERGRIRNARYRGLNPLTETETEHERDSQYESFGPGPSTATESEQEPLATGPAILPRRRVVVSTPSGSKGRSPSLLPGGARIVSQEVPVHRRAGATRPAKFKGIKTVFPYHLDTLILNRCNNLVGTTCLPVVALLGPQLRCLQLKHLSDTTDEVLITLMKACPNLKQLMLKGTEVTDTFLVECASGTREAGIVSTENERQDDQDRSANGKARASADNPAQEGYGIQKLNIDMTETTGTGLAAFIQGNRENLRSLACQHHREIKDDLINAFFMRNPSSTTIFQPNIVLTEIDLSFCGALESTSIHTLFRYATALQRIVLEGSDALDDHSLWILAKVQRQRLARLGFGVPKAWRDHVIAELQRLAAIAVSQESGQGSSTLLETVVDEQQAQELRDEALQYDGSEKVIRGDFRVPGGLRTLILRSCSFIHNRGMRAIVRSCVGLEHLDIRECPGLSIQLFNGPWAVGSRLEHLDVTDISSTSTFLRRMGKHDWDEEEHELARFPQGHVMLTDEWEETDEEEQTYGEEEAEEGEEGSDDENMEEFELDSTPSNPSETAEDANDQPSTPLSPPESGPGAPSSSSSSPSSLSNNEERTSPRDGGPLRKDARRLAYIRSFYSRLGQLSGLRQLYMAQMQFQFRVREGFNLVLPGLQRNLEIWNLEQSSSMCSLKNEILKFIGRNFGRGLIYPEGARPLPGEGSPDEDVDEDDISVKDKKDMKEAKDKRNTRFDDDDDDDDINAERAYNSGEDEEENVPFEDFHWKPRVARLKTIVISESMSHIDERVLEWFDLQGFEIETEGDEFSD